jgi:hypothetical protein
MTLILAVPLAEAGRWHECRAADDFDVASSASVTRHHEASAYLGTDSAGGFASVDERISLSYGSIYGTFSAIQHCTVNSRGHLMRGENGASILEAEEGQGRGAGTAQR